MIEKVPKSIYLLTSIVFMSISIILGFKNYEANVQNENLVKNYKLEVVTHNNELREILNRYDAELLKNKQLLLYSGILAKHGVLDSVKYKQVLENKIAEKEVLQLDSGILENKIKENKQLNNHIKRLLEANRQLQKKNSQNETVVAVSKNLEAKNVRANGIKIVSNNVIKTRRFYKTEQIRVCFTLLENNTAVKGKKDIYIQVINPSKKVVAQEDNISTRKAPLSSYSAKTNVYYENKEVDVCLFVEPKKEDLIKGDYEINIYSGVNLIGNSVLTLR